MEPRNYLSSAAATPPANPAAPSFGYPQSATPGVNEATVPGPHWFYKIGEELRSILIAAQVAPSDTDLGQLLAALDALFAPFGGDAAQAFKVKDASASNEAVSLGQFVAPVHSQLNVPVPAANSTYPLSVSFTTPCKGFVVALSSVATSGIPAGNIQTYNSINGVNGSGDNNPFPQTMETNVIAVASGIPVTVIASTITDGIPPNVSINAHLISFFIPSV